MRLKLLLLTLLISGGIFAQDTIPYRSLVITEARLNAQPDNYVEITNMGDQAVNLKDFKLGTIRPWNLAITDVFTSPWVPDNNRYIMLPDYVLEPGKVLLLHVLMILALNNTLRKHRDSKVHS